MLVAGCAFLTAGAQSYLQIHVNQAGYFFDGEKSAAVTVIGNAQPKKFHLETPSGRIVFKERLSADFGSYGPYDHTYKADFSAFQAEGEFRLVCGETRSSTIHIARSPLSNIVSLPLNFIRLQRCGEPRASGNAACHLNDATRIDGLIDNHPINLTGGWHDAADNLKFAVTTAHACYCLLLASDLNPPGSQSFNQSHRQAALDELAIGLEFLKKMNFAPGKTFIQVQDLRDHNYHWRLPENDALADDRPAYYRPSKAVNAAVAAAFALAAQHYSKRGQSFQADDYLNRATELYLESASLPDISSGPDSMYFDRTAYDNLALAATELYLATNRQVYLDSAIAHLDGRDAVIWLSWGDLAGLAYARLGERYPAGVEKLERIVAYFDSVSSGNVFGYPLAFYPWGSAAIQAGAAMLAELSAERMNRPDYYRFVDRQLAYLFGVNIYNISFVSGVGDRYPLHLHNPIAKLTVTPLTGALAEGPVDPKQFAASGIRLAREDEFSKLHSQLAVYNDDWNDYLTNEPTIAANACLYYVLLARTNRGQTSR